MKTMFGGIIKEVRGKIRKRQMKRVRGREEREVKTDRENGGGGENGETRMERGGEDYPFFLFVELSFPLPSLSSPLPPPLFLLSLY